MKNLLCRLLCPNYVAAMPPDQPGTWVACSIKVGRAGRIEVETREVSGLLNAYKTARWLALKLDLRAPQGVAVEWGVRKLSA